MFRNLLTKKAPERQSNDAPVQPHVVYLNGGIGVAFVEFSNAMAAAEAMRHPITYRAVDKIASSVSQARLIVKEDINAAPSERRGKREMLEDLQQVLDCPNENMSGTMLRYWMGLNYACYGRAPMKVSASPLADFKPTGLFPLETRYTRVVTDKRGRVTQFKYGEQEDDAEVMPSRMMRSAKQSYADHIWKPGLKGFVDHRDANNALQTVALPARVVRALLTRAIQAAEGHPNVRYLVTTTKSLTEAQKGAVRSHLEGSAPNASVRGESLGSIPILHNVEGLEIHTLDNDLSDVHSKTPSDDMARLIFGAFGIPPAVAGVTSADGAKFAQNYEQSRYAFWQDTILPQYVNPIADGLTRMLCPPGLVIAPDLMSIDALVYGRINSMKEASAVTFLSQGEKRAMFGYSDEDITDPNATPSPATNGGQNEPTT